MTRAAARGISVRAWAVLVLRDVLGFRAKEVAVMLAQGSVIARFGLPRRLP
jgi:hypothetical protein